MSEFKARSAFGSKSAVRAAREEAARVKLDAKKMKISAKRMHSQAKEAIEQCQAITERLQDPTRTPFRRASALGNMTTIVNGLRTSQTTRSDSSAPLPALSPPNRKGNILDLMFQERKVEEIAPPGNLSLVPPSETQLLIAESRSLRERNRELCGELSMRLDQVVNAANRALETSSKRALETSPKEVEVSDLLYRLTNRERAVLTLIASGYSSKEVAARLGIAFKTVVCHRTHIMEKLGIHETASLTRFAIRNGLIRA